ncbi:hypothetical protein M406DRAFT_342663 [Cryphonectria parasitica EP155]|uniref:Xaa-Pro aminopeptidase n=1 Tax=Cryphonectria parasitica (strain ATCC 38755 / EP155) TaxID=660469 RepID=A0A9P4XW56_CRYP1|nr:uncharacterized protein M406DRAFT_342663 [Cryphonectria parasitica EP155]KAF3762008.1 hypothetical protein M406DRAFT_342663 [Cryphonectria parasitica EP155]
MEGRGNAALRSWPRFYAAVCASQLQFGQPVYETHPHLLKPGELTPGITAQEYHDRRARLAQALPKNAVAILPAAEIKWRSGAVFFPFRQESNFLYLTGFNEPEAIAVIQKTGDNLGDFIFHLLVRPKDPAAEQWSGPWSGVQAAEDVFNADNAGDINKAGELLQPILKDASKIYTEGTSDSSLLKRLLRIPAGHTAAATSPLRPLLNSLRIVKSAGEIANMRQAGRISGRAITNAMRRGWKYEKDLQAYLDYAFTADGCDGPAYVPVVAGGSRANMIHYVLNNAPLEGKEMVLVDAGGEYGAYITDITRTWPVSGKFSPAQKDLYEAVLRVQRSGVSLCRADSGLSLDQIHRSTEAALRTELTKLGFELSGPGALETLFAHHVGHYVGLDVHDCPGYGRNVALKPGHCVTIEPGVYVPDDERWPKHFRGMGIRIEDSVCVDETGPIVLTTEAVKEVVDIEALRN